MLSNYVTPQLLPTLTRVGMNHQDKKLCMMPVSLGQLRAWAGCGSRTGRAGHDTSIPQPKLQDTQDEPVLLQPTHQLTSGLEGDRPHVQRYRTQQTGEAWEWVPQGCCPQNLAPRAHHQPRNCGQLQPLRLSPA